MIFDNAMNYMNGGLQAVQSLDLAREIADCRHDPLGLFLLQGAVGLGPNTCFRRLEMSVN
jgi:hypothetical protein